MGILENIRLNMVILGHFCGKFHTKRLNNNIEMQTIATDQKQE